MRFLRFWPKKCGKVRFCALLRPKTHFRSFRSKTLKTGMGQKCCSRQCFLRYFGGHFRKKAQNDGFLAFLAFGTTFGGQKLILRPKSGKRENEQNTKKNHFRSERKTVINVTFWARFWSPKRPKALFSLLGPLFRFGAFWAPKAPQKRKMSTFSLFAPKSGKSRFCDSGRKNMPRTLRLSRVLRYWRK